MTEEIKSEELKEEVKQTNFRLNQEDAEKFRKFCTENGLNHAQGFAHIIQTIEMNQAKDALPGQADNIENFEMHIKALLTGYMNLLEMNANSEARAKEKFAEQLISKDKSIMDYQEKLAKEKESVKALEGQLGELESLKKEVKLLENELITANQQIADKDNLIAMKNEKLDVAEEKVQAYDELSKEKQAVDVELADTKIRLKEKQAELDQQLELAAERCEKEKAQAVQAERVAAQKEKDALQRELLDEEKAARQREQELRDKILELSQENGQLKLDNKQLEVDNKALEEELKKTALLVDDLEEEFKEYRKQNPKQQVQQDDPDQLTIDDVTKE